MLLGLAFPGFAPAISLEHCLYFRHFSRTNFFTEEEKATFRRWVVTAKDFYDRALLAGDPQAIHMRDLGIFDEPDPERIFVKIQAQLALNAGEVNSAESGLVPVRLYEKGELFIWLPLNAPVPQGYRQLKRQLRPIEFYRIVAEGGFPLGETTASVGYFGFSLPMPLYLHDLVHFSAIRENPEYAAALRRIAIRIRDNPNLLRSVHFRDRAEHFVEYLSVASSAEKDKVSEFLLRSGFSSGRPLSVADVRAHLARLTSAERTTLAKSVVEDLPRISSQGGGSRDPIEKEFFRAGSGNVSAYVYRLLTDSDPRASASFHELAGSLPGRSALSEEEKTDRLAKVLAHASHIPHLSIHDWEKAVFAKDRNEAKPVFDFLCGSQIFRRDHNPMARYFCNGRTP